MWTGGPQFRKEEHTVRFLELADRRYMNYRRKTNSGGFRLERNTGFPRKALMTGSIRRWKITNLPSKAFECQHVILGQRR